MPQQNGMRYFIGCISNFCFITPSWSVGTPTTAISLASVPTSQQKSEMPFVLFAMSFSFNSFRKICICNASHQ